MKNTLRATIASALLLSASTAAYAADDTYVNAQIGLPQIAGFSGGLAVIATYGMPMTKLLPNAKDPLVKKLNFEAEFTSTLLSKPSSSFLGASLNYSYNTFAGYAVYTNKLSPELTFRGRGGLSMALVSFDFGSFGGSSSASSTDIGITYGFGVVYKLAGDMDAVAEYTQVAANIAHISGGVQFKF